MTENTNITPAEQTPEGSKKQACLEKLLNTYKQRFEMEMAEENDMGLVAVAHYMEKASKGRFAFMKAERHEHVFIFDVGHLNKDTFTAAINHSRENGIERIQPVKGYLDTFITSVILAEDMDEEAETLVIKNRYMTSLKKIKKGYVNQRVCAIDFSKNKVINNKDAKGLGEFMKNFLAL